MEGDQKSYIIFIPKFIDEMSLKQPGEMGSHWFGWQWLSRPRHCFQYLKEMVTKVCMCGWEGDLGKDLSKINKLTCTLNLCKELSIVESYIHIIIIIIIIFKNALVHFMMCYSIICNSFIQYIFFDPNL